MMNNGAKLLTVDAFAVKQQIVAGQGRLVA
jgi:hypothetical protein